jgi:hypothetical protein
MIAPNCRALAWATTVLIDGTPTGRSFPLDKAENDYSFVSQGLISFMTQTVSKNSISPLEGQLQPMQQFTDLDPELSAMFLLA